jgi:hypothetical protein
MGKLLREKLRVLKDSPVVWKNLGESNPILARPIIVTGINVRKS